jgi:putative alpha-1,2-mannosidase
MKQVILGIITILIFISCAKRLPNLENDDTKYVDPFIGTTGFGHCSPNACVPFGLIQVGSETGEFSWK